MIKLNIRGVFWWKIKHRYKYVKKIGRKSAKLLKKGFGSDPVYNNKSFKTKIKSYFILKQIFIMIKCQKKVFVVIVYQWYWLTLFLKWVKNYYPQQFLEEYKHIVVSMHITEDLEAYSNDSDKHDENYFPLTNAQKSFSRVKTLRSVNFCLL